MTSTVGRAAGLCLALLAAQDAWALGLGEISGQAVLGQPLRLEIPLLGTGSNVPAPHCFRVRPPIAEIGNDFVPRNARIQVVGERGGSRLIVTTAALVREPLIGFAITAGCGFELTKDYILLATLASEPAAAPLPRPASAPAAVAPAVTLPAAAPDKILRIDAETTLEALARQKYPNQPKAREKFMRMMAQANPALGGDENAIAAGTELQLPPGLPQRRIGAYQGETRATPAGAAPQPAPRPAKAPKVAGGKDRLVLGGSAPSNEAKLLEEAERLTAILVEQNKAQDALTESIARIEGDYHELQQRFAGLERRLGQIEAERLAEKQAPKPVSFDFFELLLAVLMGGAVGGLALHFHQRAQRWRHPDAAPGAPVSPSAKMRLPWAKVPTPEAEHPSVEMSAITHPRPTGANAATRAPDPVDARSHLVDFFPGTVERSSTVDTPVAAQPSAQKNLLDFHNS